MKTMFTWLLLFSVTKSFSQTYLPLNNYISSGWNIDVMAEGSSPLNGSGYRVPLATNGSISNGDPNYGDALNVSGFSGKFGTPSSYYLPSSGSIANLNLAGCTFQLQPYTSNNAIFVGSNLQQYITFNTSALLRADELVFLVATDAPFYSYYSTNCPASVVVNFSDATSESFSIAIGGLFNYSSSSKAATVGRVGTLNNNDWFWQNNNSVSLHYAKISLSGNNKLKTISSIQFASVNGGQNNYYPDFVVLAANYKPYTCPDNAIITTYYQDSDGDGYGNPGKTIQSCSAPLGYVSDNTDCNDANATVYPGATEICDGIDNNCNGQVDEGINLPSVSLSIASSTICSNDVAIFTATPVNSGNTPVYYFKKNGVVFESGTSNIFDIVNLQSGDIITCDMKTTTTCAFPQTITSNSITMTVNYPVLYYQDADGDSYGNPAVSVQACTPPAGYVGNNSDCNDNDPTKWRTGTFFFDHDRDGYTQGSTILCYGAIIPEGFVLTENGDDCDDNNYDLHESFPFYADFDGDGYGAGIPLNVCARNASSPPPGYTINNLDCDDNDNTIYPGAPELCDGKDNDCNGFIDDGIQPPPPPSVSDVAICKYSNASLIASGIGTIGWYDAPVGGNWVAGGNNFITPSLVDNTTYYVQDSTCTASSMRAPVTVTVSAPSLTATASATQVCSGTPVTLTGSGAILYSWSDGGGVFGINDGTPFIPLYTGTYYFHGSDAAGCNGSAFVTVVVDPGTIYYQDADGDGFGNPAVSSQSCVPLTGYVVNNLDCDDTKILYADNDGDEYGAGVPAACGVANNTDCDDTDPNVYPYLPSVNIDGQFNTAMGICKGTLTIFTATPFYGGTAPSYQWKKNNINVGTNSNTYTDASLANADNITCELTSNAACAINTKALSNSIFVNVHPLPIVSAGNYSSYTTNDPPFSLSGTPVGGSFSGIGVTGAGNLFDPSIAGVGDHTIYYYYTDGNSGCGNSATTIIHVSNYTSCTSAPMIANIAGSTTACGIAGTSTSASYSIDNIEGATYVWTKSSSLIQIISGQNTNRINATFSSNFSSGTITVTVTNSCGNAVRTISITKKSPATPGTIAGITNACSYIGTSVKYVIAKVAGATSYTWIVPTGASIAGKTSPYTSSDTSINVTFSSSFTGGNITVNSSNACGISAAKAISITNKIPAIPGTISGPTDVCNFIFAHTNITYTINKVTDATSYQWLIPAGVNIISTNVTDTSIILNFPGSYTTGTIQVKAKAGCGDGAYRSLTVTKKLPSTPGAITTLGDICTSIYTGTNSVSYTIPGNTTAPLPDSYIWTLTPTISGSALITGGTGVIGSLPNSFVETTGLSIQVQFYGNYTGGTLLVVAKRSCGTSNARTLTLTKNLPPVPSFPVASGTICSGVAVSVSYTVSPNANTSSYIWSSPKGTKITGAQIKTPKIDTTTSNTITVSYPSNFTSGNLTVKARSVCGTGSAVTLAVSAAPCTILSDNLSKENNIAIQRESALIYPDPNNGDFILKIQSANKTDKVKIQLIDVLGQAIKEYTAPNDNGNIVLHVNERSLAAGIYFLKYKIGREVKYVKFVVQK